MLKKLIFLLVLLLFAASTSFAATYKVDPVHSQVHFTVAHLVVFKVKGAFDKYSGEVEVDPASGAISSVKATIQADSINTREQKRDDHLRSTDFFDVANHPEMTFVSKDISGSGVTITVHGDLTIRGTTRPIVLTGSYLGAATDPWGNIRAGFEATGKINRQDFGLTWNKVLETGGFVVGDEIEIGLEIEAVRI